MYCKSGGGYITAGHRYKALGGHMYLAKPGMVHAIEASGDMHLLEIKFLADESFMSQIPEELDLGAIPTAREMLLLSGEEGIKCKPHHEDASNCAFRLFLINVLRHLSSDNSENRPYAHSAALDIPQQAKENSDILILNLRYFISDKLSDEITLQMLADEVNFSKAYFIKRFRILFGMSPIRYVNLCRIERAKLLMEQTELPLSEIALKCGFASPHYFSRTFRSFEGVPPQEYRQAKKL